MPREAYVLLEEELERIRLLAGIDEELPQEVQDGLCLEYLCINSALTPEESIV